MEHKCHAQLENALFRQMPHSLAPRMVPFPMLGSWSSDLGALVCVTLECGSNIDIKNHLNSTMTAACGI